MNSTPRVLRLKFELENCSHSLIAFISPLFIGSMLINSTLALSILIRKLGKSFERLVGVVIDDVVVVVAVAVAVFVVASAVAVLQPQVAQGEG